MVTLAIIITPDFLYSSMNFALFGVFFGLQRFGGLYERVIMLNNGLKVIGDASPVDYIYGNGQV